MPGEEPIPEPPAPPRLPGPGSNLFQNERGLRAGWRLLIYIALVFALGVVVIVALESVLHVPKGVRPPPWLMFAEEAIAFALILVPAVVMSRLEGRPVGAYGLPARELFGRRFWQGWALGAVEVSVLIGAIAACGGYSFGTASLAGPRILAWGLF